MGGASWQTFCSRITLPGEPSPRDTVPEGPKPVDSSCISASFAGTPPPSTAHTRTCVDERAPHGVHALLRECFSLFAERAYATPAAERLAPPHISSTDPLWLQEMPAGVLALTRCGHGGWPSCHSRAQPRAPLPKKKAAR